MSKKPVSAQDKFMLRLPDGMREAISKRAKENVRSMNAEIVNILDSALSGEGSNEGLTRTVIVKFKPSWDMDDSFTEKEVINLIRNASKESNNDEK
jgi:plasmid stability protein